MGGRAQKKNCTFVKRESALQDAEDTSHQMFVMKVIHSVKLVREISLQQSNTLL